MDARHSGQDGKRTQPVFRRCGVSACRGSRVCRRDGARVLVLSRPGAAKVRNIETDPEVALHLDTEADAGDGGVLTIEGAAELAPGRISEPEAASYVAKYLDVMKAAGLTPDEAFTELSQVIRMTPTRVRMY
jgi:PPOX class probable F420-dependent enzyme